MSFLFAYANSFIRTEKMLFDYVTTKKDTRLWISPVEAVLALAYIRFRSGAKFRLEKDFKIANDHSHPIKLGDYSFDFQGIKRTLMGGNSMDLLNFKTPIYYSDQVFSLLRPENREIILKVAIESVHSLLDTYEKDIMACEALKSIGVILECMLNNKDLEQYKPFLYINEDFHDSPLTKKDTEVWTENIDILNRICNLYKQAYTDFSEGKKVDDYLDEISDLRTTIRTKLCDFLMEIPRGRS
jgi:hypothetical protein